MDKKNDRMKFDLEPRCLLLWLLRSLWLIVLAALSFGMLAQLALAPLKP